jgi:hypothetical protein
MAQKLYKIENHPLSICSEGDFFKNENWRKRENSGEKAWKEMFSFF